MEMQFTKEDLAFKSEVRSFLEKHLPERLVQAQLNDPAVFVEHDISMEWQRILHQKGWVGVGWPSEFGGTGWTPVQQYIFTTECAKAGAPGLSPLGIKLAGPVIYTYGTQDQKDRFLAPLLSGEHFWCQGFSEPGSGSDLASLKTRAVREGDHYRVNGTKIWTSLAHHSNWIFCLVRTNTEVKAQLGISFLLIDMESEGVDVKPIITLAGEHEVNQVFFDDVKVPMANLVGNEGQGWDIAKFLLANERGGSPAAPALIAAFERLKQAAREEPDGLDSVITDDPTYAMKLARLQTQLESLEVMELRLLDQVSKGQELGPQSSISKIVASNLRQAIDELGLEIFGHNGLQLETARPLYGSQSPIPVGSDAAQLAMPTYLNNRAWTIFGGSNEVQKTILAKTVLGL